MTHFIRIIIIIKGLSLYDPILCAPYNFPYFFSLSPNIPIDYYDFLYSFHLDCLAYFLYLVRFVISWNLLFNIRFFLSMTFHILLMFIEMKRIVKNEEFIKGTRSKKVNVTQFFWNEIPICLLRFNFKNSRHLNKRQDVKQMLCFNKLIKGKQFECLEFCFGSEFVFMHHTHMVL